MVFTANHLTDTDKQNGTGKQTRYKSEKVNNLKYSKTKLPWFSCLLQQSARKRGGHILHRPRAHTGPCRYNVLLAALTPLLKMTAYVSSYHVIPVSVERYIAIVYPLHYDSKCN